MDKNIEKEKETEKHSLFISSPNEKIKKRIESVRKIKMKEDFISKNLVVPFCTEIEKDINLRNRALDSSCKLIEKHKKSVELYKEKRNNKLLSALFKKKIKHVVEKEKENENLSKLNKENQKSKTSRFFYCLTHFLSSKINENQVKCNKNYGLFFSFSNKSEKYSLSSLYLNKQENLNKLYSTPQQIYFNRVLNGIFTDLKDNSKIFSAYVDNILKSKYHLKPEEEIGNYSNSNLVQEIRLRKNENVYYSLVILCNQPPLPKGNFYYPLKKNFNTEILSSNFENCLDYIDDSKVEKVVAEQERVVLYELSLIRIASLLGKIHKEVLFSNSTSTNKVKLNSSVEKFKTLLNTTTIYLDADESYDLLSEINEIMNHLIEQMFPKRPEL